MRWSRLGGLLLGCLACTETPAAPPDHITLTGATLEVGPALTVTVDEAQLHRSGAGEGTGAHVVQRDDGPRLEVTSDRTAWDLSTHAAEFTGSVEATRGAMRLWCDRLEVTLSQGDAPRITTAVATGNVRIERADELARAARAELESESGRLVLTGDPRLRDGDNEMQGDRIVLWLDDDRAECERCRVVVTGALVGRPDAGP